MKPPRGQPDNPPKLVYCYTTEKIDLGAWG